MGSNRGIGPTVVSANKDDELGCATMVWKFDLRYLMSGFCLGGFVDFGRHGCGDTIGVWAMFRDLRFRILD